MCLSYALSPILAGCPSLVTSLSALTPGSCADGVRNNPDSVPAVRRVDACSRKYGREDFVAFTFQVSAHRVENQPFIPTKEAANVLRHDVGGASLSNDSKHFRPEISVVGCPGPLSCCTKGLAGEATRNDGYTSAKVSCVEGLDIVEGLGFGEVVGEYLTAEGVALNVEDVGPPHPLGGEVETSDA